MISTFSTSLDNSEVVRKYKYSCPKLGTKQKTTLNYDLLASTQRLLNALPCKLLWNWVKETSDSERKKWKVEIDINMICD